MDVLFDVAPVALLASVALLDVLLDVALVALLDIGGVGRPLGLDAVLVALLDVLLDVRAFVIYKDASSSLPNLHQSPDQNRTSIS